MTHTTTVPLRWSDLDAVGHVNNATYLTLCEQCRVEALAALDAADWTESGPVVAEATVRYLRPITDAVPVEVSVTFGQPGLTSIATTQEIRLPGDEAPRATAEVRLVWVDASTGRPTPIPDRIRQQLTGPTSGTTAET